MTDAIHHPDGPDTPDDHQRAVETCKHATDALETGPQDSA